MHQEKSGNPDIGREKSFQRKLWTVAFGWVGIRDVLGSGWVRAPFFGLIFCGLENITQEVGLKSLSGLGFSK
jgi:hypothetical protein